MIDSFLKQLQFEKRVSPHTLLAYQNDLSQWRDFLAQNFSNTLPENAGYASVRAWLVTLVEAGLEPTSVNRKIASLRSFYKHLLRQEIIDKDPMMKIRVLKSKKKLPSFVKQSEMDTMLDEPSGIENETLFERVRNKLILEMFYVTGIRLSELIGLQEAAIDMNNRTVKVLGKRNKERVIPFPSSIVSSIKDYLEIRNRDVEQKGHGCFFVTAKGEKCYPVMIYRMVKHYLSVNTHTDKRSPHVLRHTFATHLLDKGAEINAVKDLLGHSSLAATQVYTHNSMEKLKKVFEQAHPKA